MQKDRFAILRSRSQQGLIWSDDFCHSFWTADPFATKLCLMVQYHNSECPMKKLDCCAQDQSHSKTSKCLWMSRQYLLNHWTFYYQTWYDDASSWARSFKMIGLLSSRSRSQWRLIKSKYNFLSSELLILLQLNLLWWHIVISWIVLWKDGFAVLWSRSQERFKTQVNVHLDGISSIAEPLVTKLGMVMNHHGPVSCKKIGLLFSRSRSHGGLI